MIISSYSNIDIIQGVIGYGDAEGITDWRIANTSNGIFNILNSTSSDVKMTILENGNVGIGIPTPVSALDINGNLNISGNYTKNNRDVVNDTSNYVLSTSNILVNRITSLPTTGGSSQWTTGATNFIYYNTSNVGIGATNPSSKLHIYDDNISSTRLIIQNNNAAALTSSTLNISSSPVAPLSGSVGNDKYYIYTTGTYTLTIPTGGAICDIFMIGGGGGGGHNCAGGGGAGACIVAIGQTINAGNYTITIGNGGPGAAVNSSANGTIGGDSSIGSLYVAKGGGFGAGQGTTTQIGGTGGCGGGAAGGGSAVANSARSSLNVVNGTTNISPSTTSTYSVLGNIGGSSAGFTAPNWHQLNGAGGGGIGATGTNSSISACGTGGNGVFQVVINSTTYNLRSYFTNNETFGVQDGSTGNYYIGGGGGGAGNQTSGTITISGGLGGGGNAFDTASSLSGTAGNTNTGSGGGGGIGVTATGGAGGSGLVIIRQRLLQSVAMSSIELIRGVSSDSNVDYKIGNYGGDFKIFSSSSNIDTEYIRITSTGAISNPSGTTSWTTTSDRRIKENIEKASYDICYENINNLELNRFNYVEGFNNVNKDIRQLGFIAQEVKDIFPKAVLSYSYNNNNFNIPDLLSIDITQINYSLYGAVKKLMKMNDDKDRRIKRLETLLNIEDAPIDTSNISLDTSNISLDTSNIAIDTSNIAIDTSNIAIDTSNIAIDTSNIAIDTSNIAIDTSNIAIDTSNIAIDTSNIAIDTSNISIDTSNITIDTSNLSIDTSNIALDTSNIAIDASNISLDTSNITIDTSNLSIDTSNIAIDTSNIAIDTSNISIDTSNITIDASNISLDASNITIDTSNIAIDTSNITLDTSNITLDTSNI